MRGIDDGSFPEPESFNGADMRPLPNVNRSQKGEIHARIKERDCRELAAVLRQFQAQYGEAELQRVFEELNARGDEGSSL